MTKFRRCRRPHQSRSPQNQHHRTQCHRRGRLQDITLCDIFTKNEVKITM